MALMDSLVRMEGLDQMEKGSSHSITTLRISYSLNLTYFQRKFSNDHQKQIKTVSYICLVKYLTNFNAGAGGFFTLLNQQRVIVLVAVMQAEVECEVDQENQDVSK